MCLLCQRTANSYSVCAWCPLLVYVFFYERLGGVASVEIFRYNTSRYIFALPWYVFIALRAFHLFYLTAAAIMPCGGRVMSPRTASDFVLF